MTAITALRAVDGHGHLAYGSVHGEHINVSDHAAGLAPTSWQH